LKKQKLLLLLLTLSVTSACGTGSTVAAVSDYCRIAKPISYDGVGDSPETVKAVEEHNSKWACVCENDCPTKPPAG
jgi:hypothetical protein